VHSRYGSGHASTAPVLLGGPAQRHRPPAQRVLPVGGGGVLRGSSGGRPGRWNSSWSFLPPTWRTSRSCGSGCSTSGSTSTSTPRSSCGWASTRSTRRARTLTRWRTPRRRTSSCSRTGAAATAGPARPWSARTRGTCAWWRYRVPGLGEVDWRRVVDTLYEGGVDGVLSVEHEDPVWGGDPRGPVGRGLVALPRSRLGRGRLAPRRPTPCTRAVSTAPVRGARRPCVGR
jgi:hypothetical protein